MGVEMGTKLVHSAWLCNIVDIVNVENIEGFQAVASGLHMIAREGLRSTVKSLVH